MKIGSQRTDACEISAPTPPSLRSWDLLPGLSVHFEKGNIAALLLYAVDTLRPRRLCVENDDIGVL